MNSASHLIHSRRSSGIGVIFLRISTVLTQQEASMHKYIIMGVQGCGKGTQAAMLVEAFDLVHISVGEIFRWHIKSHTKLGAKVKRIVASGNLWESNKIGTLRPMTM